MEGIGKGGGKGSRGKVHSDHHNRYPITGRGKNGKRIW